MGGEAELFEDGIDLVIILACIQAHPLWSLCCGLWPLNDQAFDRCAGQFHIMPVGPFSHQANRHPVPLSQQAALDAGLAPVGGIGSGFFPRPAALS